MSFGDFSAQELVSSHFSQTPTHPRQRERSFRIFNIIDILSKIKLIKPPSTDMKYI